MLVQILHSTFPISPICKLGSHTVLINSVVIYTEGLLLLTSLVDLVTVVVLDLTDITVL